MKTLIHASALFSSYLALGIVLSCADRNSAKAKTSVATPQVASFEITKREQLNGKAAPVLVQQFHGCKAHR